LDNPCGTSVLILEKVAQSLTTVCIDGILPCTAIVRTSHPSFVEFHAEDKPTYVRGMFRWSRARENA
ncbi:MAG: hypothetical protein JWQ43_300, partial [Glaciihabitans sp.]|nr:hypothetical protein [Glaciihabitans sp.]